MPAWKSVGSGPTTSFSRQEEKRRDPGDGWDEKKKSETCCCPGNPGPGDRGGGDGDGPDSDKVSSGSWNNGPVAPLILRGPFGACSVLRASEEELTTAGRMCPDWKRKRESI